VPLEIVVCGWTVATQICLRNKESIHHRQKENLCKLGYCIGTTNMLSRNDENLRKHQIKEGTLFMVKNPKFRLLVSAQKATMISQRQPIKTPPEI